MRGIAMASILIVLASLFIFQSEIKAPANTVESGIPPVPTSIGRESFPYRGFYGSNMVGWDPVKLEVIARRYTLAGTIQVARFKSPGHAPDFFTQLPAFREMYYEPHGKYILYTQAADANFQSQIYRYDIETKASSLLTDGKSKNLYPIWSHSGKLLAYSSTQRNGSDLDIYVMDPLDRSTSHMVAQVKGSDWAVFDWSPDDQKLLLSDYQGDHETFLWLLNLANGERTLLTPKLGDEPVFNGSYAWFNKDGKGIFISTDRGSDFRRLAYLDLSTKQYKFLTENIPWDVDEFALSPNGKTLAFVSNEDGQGRLHLMNTETYKELPVPELPVGIVSALKWHSTEPYLGFEFTSTRNPSDIYSVRIDTGKLERWTTATTATNTNVFREPELIKWRSFDGKMISGYLYRPPASFPGKRPVMIQFHGGLHDQFRPAFLGGEHYFIEKLGVALICPNIRGSAGYGKAFQALDDKYRRSTSFKDAEALLDWIKSQPGLDSDRVLVEGASYGAYVSLTVAEMFPNRIAGAISESAPTNLATLIERTVNNNPDPWRQEIGDERDSKMRKFLNEIAPVTNAGKIKKPVFLIVGAKDLITSVDETQQILHWLQANHVPVWYLEAKDESHGFRDPKTYDYMFNSEVVFVNRFLLADGS